VRAWKSIPATLSGGYKSIQTMSSARCPQNTPFPKFQQWTRLALSMGPWKILTHISLQEDDNGASLAVFTTGSECEAFVLCINWISDRQLYKRRPLNHCAEGNDGATAAKITLGSLSYSDADLINRQRCVTCSQSTVRIRAGLRRC
jgi:hypothetical protein